MLVKKVVPRTLATVLVTFISSATGDEIREAFKELLKDGMNENI